VVSKIRLQRINERIHHELSELMIQVVNDPRLMGVSITGVKVDRELAFADIYISAPDGSQRSREILEVLNHARGFLRTELANRVDLRIFPRLRFHWDPTPERADHIERLYEQIRQERQAKETSSTDG
jgi:ribosome-binding factor A